MRSTRSPRRAARGQPTFDVFVLDPGPRVSGIEAGVFDKFTPSKLTNLGAVPAGWPTNGA